jgi:Cu/Ag efflux protein CusF
MEIIPVKYSMLLSFAIKNGAIVCFDKDTGMITVRHNGITSVHSSAATMEEIKKSVGITRIREPRTKEKTPPNGSKAE